MRTGLCNDDDGDVAMGTGPWDVGTWDVGTGHCGTWGRVTVSRSGNLQIVYEYDLRKTLYYDAENRIWKAEVYNTQAGTTATTIYVYDGEGKRVKRRLGVAQETEDVLRFVYNATGTLVAEYGSLTQAPVREHIYDASGLIAVADAVEGMRYVTPDHLGTPRVAVKEGYVVASRHDYYPFGEELLTEERRLHVDGYLRGDGVRQRFTAYERDTETNLDFAQARYFASTHGRFASPDIPFIDQNPAHPQSWNRYTYCLNNPLAFIDPTGLAHTNDKGEWVGDDDGEYDEEQHLYWNKKNQQWENRENDDITFDQTTGDLLWVRLHLFGS